MVQRIDYDVTGRVTGDTSRASSRSGSLVGSPMRNGSGAVRCAVVRRADDPVAVARHGRVLGRSQPLRYADGDPVNRSTLAGIDCFQDLLGLAGMIPVVGTVCDVANVAIYLSRGHWGAAGLAVAGTSSSR